MDFTNGQKRGKCLTISACADGGLFSFAGLWDYWEGEGFQFSSCSIIVTTANDLIEPIHERMPVIIPPSDYDKWIDNRITDKGKLQAMLRPYGDVTMRAYPVSTFVNVVRNDSPGCIRPVD